MKQQGRIMVIWSYLLLGASAPASIDSVLSPVGETASVANSSGELAAVAVADERDARPASRPLVQVGADELDLLAEIERLVAARLQPAGELRLTPLSSMPVLAAGASLPCVEILDAPSRLSSGTALVRFKLTEGERVIGTYAVPFRPRVLAAVWVPTRRIAVGEALAADAFVTREVDMLREPKAVPAEVDALVRYELARAVSPERLLTWNDITPRSLVRKGQFVEVVASDGSLSISMKGQATRSGGLGEFITIRNLESKREFSAEVVDENKVRVHF